MPCVISESGPVSHRAPGPLATWRLAPQDGRSAGAGRCSTSGPAAGTPVPWSLPARHPPAGLPASGCRDGLRLAICQPPPGPYERLARLASGAYDSLATVCVMHVGLLASDGCFSSALTAAAKAHGAGEVLPGADALVPADQERPGARLASPSLVSAETSRNERIVNLPCSPGRHTITAAAPRRNSAGPSKRSRAPEAGARTTNGYRIVRSPASAAV